MSYRRIQKKKKAVRKKKKLITRYGPRTSCQRKGLKITSVVEKNLRDDSSRAIYSEEHRRSNDNEELPTIDRHNFVKEDHTYNDPLGFALKSETSALRKFRLGLVILLYTARSLVMVREPVASAMI